MNTLQDLRDVLADEQHEQHDLRAPDLDAVMSGGRTLRRRRTTTRAIGAVAAAAVVVAGAAGATRLAGGDAADAGVAATPDAVAEHAARAREAHVLVDTRVRRFAGIPLEVGAWSGTRPDGEQGSRALPRDDREWATLQWLRWSSDLPTGGRLYVSVDNGPAAGSTGGPPVGQERRACTSVYPSCTTTRLPDGVVAVERGRTDSGDQGLRASFTPDDADGSWVMVDVTTPLGVDPPYTRQQLVDLVTDPDMSIPVPLSTDELP